MTLTKEQLVAARAAQDWTTLWEAAIPLAKLTVRRLMEYGDLDPAHSTSDLMQDALLAAGEAVRLWEPEKGAFSTWIPAYAKRRILNSIQAAATGMVGGRQNGLFTVSMHGEPRVENPFRQDENRDSGIEACLVYEENPEGLRDPSVEAEVLDFVQLVRQMLESLEPEEAEMLKCLFGIGGLTETRESYAKHEGIPLRSLERKLAETLKKLAGSS